MRVVLLTLAALAALALMPSGQAGMGDAYDLEDIIFVGYACQPTEEETSVAQTPRADILGVHFLHPSVTEQVQGQHYATDVVSANLTGPANRANDATAVLGDPRTSPLAGHDPEGMDRSRFASLGGAGYMLLEMGTSVTDGSGDDLVVYESARHAQDWQRVTFSEPFCVYGSNSPAGPFSYVGLWLPPPDSGFERAAFDLGDYKLFSGTDSLRYVLIMDSGQSDLIIEAAYRYDRLDDLSLTPIQFTDLTGDPAGRLVSWQWSFGDGHQASVQNPSHTYAKSGTYEVCLAVEDNAGVKGEECKDVNVVNRAPAPDFTVEGQFERRETLTFTNTSLDLDGTVDLVRWDMGDGTLLDGPVVTHAYEETGDYLVTMTVTDDEGALAAIQKTVSIVNNPPTAAFVIEDHPGSTRTPIQFTDASFDLDGRIVDWQWDFGDGHGSDQQHPQHAFATLGQHSISLTVTDNAEAQDTFQASLLLDNEGPIVSIEGPTAGFTGQTIRFDGFAEDDTAIASTAWHVEDRAGVAGDILHHVFTDIGDYDVVFRATDDEGGWAEARHTIHIENRPPQPTIIVKENPDATRVQYRFDFEVEDDGEIVAWAWDFGDGIRSADPAPAHAFDSVGQHTVSLTVTDDRGGIGSTTAVIDVSNDAPWPHIAWFPGDAEGDVIFEDQSRDTDGAIIWRQWNIDGVNYDDARVPVSFAEPDATYRVSLRVQDNDGTTMHLVRFVTPSELERPIDSDGDGILDTGDNCADASNPDQFDADGDGLGDACDPDRDGDGVANDDDGAPDDAQLSADADQDGIDDARDPDDDNDGIPDDVEKRLKTNPLSSDSDGDGLGDDEELALGSDPLDAASPDAAAMVVLDDAELSWGATDARTTSYDVWRIRDGEATKLARLPADALTFTDTEAQAGDTYRIDTIHGTTVGGSTTTAPLGCLQNCEAGTPWTAVLPWSLGGLALVGAAIGTSTALGRFKSDNAWGHL